jgi:hypothetical protein
MYYIYKFNPGYSTVTTVHCSTCSVSVKMQKVTHLTMMTEYEYDGRPYVNNM